MEFSDMVGLLPKAPGFVTSMGFRNLIVALGGISLHDKATFLLILVVRKND